MVDDFIVCVDRIIASALLESKERLMRGEVIVENGGVEKLEKILKNSEAGFVKKNGEVGCSRIVRECRICQEEDEEHEMEAPCACNGTLKFAHRKCIQRWCNKKGDVTCEICNQVFSPNYDLPPPKSNPDVLAIDIRHQWGSHIDLRDPHFLALPAAERQFLQAEYDDYAVASSGSIACFRSVAIILMLILLLRQTLMLTREFGMMQESSTFFNVSLLQLAGFLLPCYAMARSCYIVQSRRRRQAMNNMFADDHLEPSLLR